MTEAATGVVRPLYVLLHGWGFDAGVWDGMRARLPAADVLALDYGYFGAPQMPAPPADRPLIAVGHSFGAMLLLSRPDVAWAGFVAINGFARFAFAVDYAGGVRRRLIDQMIRRFADDPATVLADFRARCGETAPPPAAERLHSEMLAAGLRALRDDDARERAAALDCPALFLAGDADPVVSPEMTLDSAACCRHVRTELLPGGGHLLPRAAPDWCVGRLTAFTRELTGETG